LYGTGEAGNNATHELDVARWALDVEYPSKVDVYAGKYHYTDDGWTMYDTMEAKFKFSNDKLITWAGQSRNAFKKDIEGGRGTKIFGSKGTVLVNRSGYKVFDLSNRLIYNSREDQKFIKIERSMTHLHFDNFFNSISHGEKLNSPIEAAAISQSMVHYANISYRINKDFKINPKNGRINDRKAKKMWSREYEKGWNLNNIS
jgi:predicted dehydrogenase